MYITRVLRTCAMESRYEYLVSKCDSCVPAFRSRFSLPIVCFGFLVLHL